VEKQSIGRWTRRALCHDLFKGDDTPISPGEFRDVDVPSGAVKDNIMLLPYKEPSQVLAGLMNQIIDEGRRFASAADLKISDMSAQSPVGTTLAILERTLKIMSAVQARIHYAMHEEFRLLKKKKIIFFIN
jgi:hypothetical protein